jgi:hypothetical protein
MKKIISLLCVLAISSFAQKGTEFQAFSGEFLKVGDMKAGYHPFTMPVQGEGWAFKAEGEVQAPAGDPYVLLDGILDGTVYAVVAYVPAVAAGTDAKDYQVGMFDMMIYLEDESVKVRNVKFTLLPPANDEWASDMARDANEIGAASKATLWSGANDVAITRTSAVPLTKKDLQPPPPKPVVRNLPPPPAEEVAPAPEEEAPVVKKKRVVKKKKVVAEPEEEEEEAPAPKKKKRVVKKKKVVEPEEEEVEPAPKKKKRVVKKKVIKKKRVVVEEEPEEEEEELTIREKRRRAATKRQKAAQNSDYE